MGISFFHPISIIPVIRYTPYVKKHWTLLAIGLNHGPATRLDKMRQLDSDVGNIDADFIFPSTIGASSASLYEALRLFPV
jgi:hypothetical protein